MQASTPQYKAAVQSADQTVEHSVQWTLPAVAGLSRVNLATDPSIEGTTTLWVASGTPTPSISISSVRAFSGSQSLLITWATGNTFLTNGVYPLTTTPGLTYTISAYVWVPTGSPAVFLYASSVGLGGFSAASTLNNQWQRLNVTFTATLTFHYIGITPAATPTAGQQCWVDALLIESGSTLGSYFDGNTAGASWTGDPNRSTSILPSSLYQDLSLTVESLTVDRQLTTDMPDGTRLITGYPAATANLTLSGLVDQTPGASKSIAWLLNPAEPTSPLFRSDVTGSPITIKAGLYTPGSGSPELFTTFTGIVDDYTVDAQAGTASLTCMDNRGKFTNAPPVPVGAFSDDSTAITYAPSSLGQLLTPGWLLNAFCESIGLYTAPPPRNTPWFRMTNHGGAWPELGSTAAIQVYAPAFIVDGTVEVPADDGWTAGKFAAQVPNQVLVLYNNIPTVGLPNGIITGNMGSSGDPWFFECWVKPTSNVSLVEPDGSAVFLAFQSTDGNTSFSMGAAATSLGSALRPYVNVTTFTPGLEQTVIHPASLTIPNDGSWHYLAVAFHYTSSTGITATFYVDGSTQTASTTRTNAVTGTIQIGQATIAAWCPAESIQVTNEPGTPPSNAAFTPSSLVDIDPSLNNLTAFPDVTGQDAWGVIQQIAQAEGAVCGFDELGVFKFVNRETLRTQTDQRTITPTYSLKTLQQEVGRSFVRNHIQVPVNALQVQKPGSVWSLSALLGVPGKTTKSVFVTFPDPVVNMDQSAQVMPTGGGTPGLSYFRAASHADGGGIELANLTITITQLTPTTAVIQIRNPNVGTAWLLSPAAGAYPPSSDGAPCLVIGGQLVTPTAAAQDNTASASAAVVADAQWPPASEGGAVTNPRGEQLLTVNSNPFIQDQDLGQAFADDNLADLYKPRPLWRNTQIVADLSLQLADRVAVNDPDVTMINDSALIVGVHFSASQTDWTQTLDLRSIGTPGGWLMGVVGRSEMGVATYV